MKISLYQAAADVRALLEMVDENTGELPEGFEQARAIVATKAQGVAAFILENDATADMVEAHAKSLLDSAKAARKRSQFLRQYLQLHMDSVGVRSIKADDGTFSVNLEKERDVSVDIFDAARLPLEYLREIPAKHEADKTLIKKAIGDGFDVPGARLLKKDRLSIR